MPRVFIAYGRDETAAAYAAWLAYRARVRWGAGSVYMQGPSAEHDPEDVDRALSEAEVALAVIGPETLRSLGRPGDLFWFELSAALATEIVVAPVLVEGVVLDWELLPNQFRALADRQVIRLTSDRLEHDIEYLLSAIEDVANPPVDLHARWNRARPSAMPERGRDEPSRLLATAASRGVVSAAALEKWPLLADRGARASASVRTEPARAPAPMSPARRTLGWAAGGALFAAAALAVIKWVTGFPFSAGDVVAREPDVMDAVDCTVFACPRVRRHEPALIQVFVHDPEDALYAAAFAEEADPGTRRRVFKSLSCLVARGATISFTLRMPGAEIELPATDSIVWRGRAQGVQFEIVVRDEAVRALVGTVMLAVNGAPVGHVKFRVAVGEDVSEQTEPIGELAHAYRQAFVSYAREDRERVLERLQLAPALRVRYFLDLLSQHPGTVWTEELEHAIDQCDLFLLFWSHEAKRSSWVRREVRRALDRKAGSEEAPPEIFPVILDGPPIVTPWKELSHLHFEDALLYFKRPTEGSQS